MLDWDVLYNGHSTGGQWSTDESGNHINVLEMKGAPFSLKVYCKIFFNISVHFKNDNTSNVVCFNKQAVPNEEIDLLSRSSRSCNSSSCLLHKIK